MRARTNFAVDLIALAVYLVATNPFATGTPVHEWLSICIALVVFVHLVLHWDWTVHVAKRVLRKLGAVSRVNFVVDVALLLGFVTVVMSGLAVSRAALKPLGRVVSESSPWHAVHSQSSTVLLALVGLHLGLHWHWLVSAFQHQIVSPLRGSGATHKRSTGVSAAARAARASTVRSLRGRMHSAGNAVAAAAVTLAIAGAIYGAVDSTGGRLLPTWLELPGGSAAALTRPPASPAVGVRALPDATARGETRPSTASGFSGDQMQRVAVRAAHSLVVVALAMALAITLRGLLQLR